MTMGLDYEFTLISFQSSQTSKGAMSPSNTQIVAGSESDSEDDDEMPSLEQVMQGWGSTAAAAAAPLQPETGDIIWCKFRKYPWWPVQVRSVVLWTSMAAMNCFCNRMVRLLFMRESSLR